MSAGKEWPEKRAVKRTIQIDADGYWLMPHDELREMVVRMLPPNPGSDPLAKIFRLLAQGTMEYGASAKGVKPWPDELTRDQAAQRAAQFLDLADMLDGLGTDSSSEGGI